MNYENILKCIDDEYKKANSDNLEADVSNLNAMITKVKNKEVLKDMQELIEKTKKRKQYTEYDYKTLSELCKKRINNKIENLGKKESEVDVDLTDDESSSKPSESSSKPNEMSEDKKVPNVFRSRTRTPAQYKF